MRILHFADSHFSSKRFDECERNFSYMVDYAIDNNCTVAVCAGDLFDKNTMINSKEYRSAINQIRKLSYYMPVYIIRGNHDPLKSLTVLENISDNIHVYENYYISKIEDKNGEFIDTLFLPYINPAMYMSSAKTITDVYSDASAYYRNIVSDFIKRYQGLIVAHISVLGAEMGNSEKIVSGEVMLEPKDFDGAKAVLLGHIHKHKQRILNGTRIQYSGSHYRMKFGETGVPGFIIWDINDDISYEFIKTPAKEMKEIVIDSDKMRDIINGDDQKIDVDTAADYRVTIEIEDSLIGAFDKKKILEKFPENMDVAINIKTVIAEKTDDYHIVDSNKLVDKFKHWADVNNIEITDSMLSKVDLVEENRGYIL